MNGTSVLVVGERGRVVIPAGTRARRHLEAGVKLTLIETDSGMVLLTREQLLRRVRSDYAGSGLVEELLADRRQEAAKEAE
ncbi:MAG: AbrB/MazE/SpoVT family DNA-binding domain-containing protein [Bifidobacteriaceae bacterium]|jgi:AbrB family looped-hinge helix DNA binding protein|nr:AbrB/MazE/SpoVT family DNA-binding domain-containing protein [Bifidobacteriaceae bacterium]